MSLAADIEELLSRECTDCMDGNSSKLLEQKVINVGEMGLSANALDDLEKVTKQAYTMVAYYGLDEEIGPISFYDSSGQNERLLGKPYSENMAQQIDKEVKELVTTAYERTKNLLNIHKVLAPAIKIAYSIHLYVCIDVQKQKLLGKW